MPFCVGARSELEIFLHGENRKVGLALGCGRESAYCKGLQINSRRKNATI
jgi:hypothetical protein